jgi:uroporphyrinogen-III synthase
VNAKRLEGLGVVLTRPRHAAEALAAPLAAAGARVFIFPTLAIEDLPVTPALAQMLAGLERYSLAIFVSANAVEKGLQAVLRTRPWPAATRVAAVGEATAQALRNSGFAEVISPRERHDSDALLALPQLQSVSGENVIVFRGQGGRERLKDGLESRGARVDYAECYRRVRPDADPAALLDAWSRGEVHAVSALSAETLDNFIALVGDEGRARLAQAVLVVPHEAVGASREARHFARVVVAPHGPQGLIDALSQIRVTT